MAFNFPGSATVNVAGQVNVSNTDPYATAVITTVNFITGSVTGAVPGGKRWRIISACCVDESSSVAGYVFLVANDGSTVEGRIIQTAGAAASTSQAVTGDCVAIVAATKKIKYNGKGSFSYIEENA